MIYLVAIEDPEKLENGTRRQEKGPISGKWLVHSINLFLPTASISSRIRGCKSPVLTLFQSGLLPDRLRYLASWTTEKTLLLNILGLRQVGVHNLKFLRPEYLTHLGLVVFESMGLIHHKAGPADGAKCCLINGDQLIRCQENMELHLCLPLSTQHYPFGCHPTSKSLNPHFLPRHPVLTMTAKGSQLSCPATLAPCRDY